MKVSTQVETRIADKGWSSLDVLTLRKSQSSPTVTMTSEQT